MLYQPRGLGLWAPKQVSQLFKNFQLVRSGISILLIFFGALLLLRNEVQISDTAEIAGMLSIVLLSVIFSQPAGRSFRFYINMFGCSCWFIFSDDHWMHPFQRVPSLSFGLGRSRSVWSNSFCACGAGSSQQRYMDLAPHKGCSLCFRSRRYFGTSRLLRRAGRGLGSTNASFVAQCEAFRQLRHRIGESFAFPVFRPIHDSASRHTRAVVLPRSHKRSLQRTRWFPASAPPRTIEDDMSLKTVKKTVGTWDQRPDRPSSRERWEERFETVGLSVLRLRESGNDGHVKSTLPDRKTGWRGFNMV